MRITVMGLGKIGLPLAVQYASKGHFVQGVDINHKTVELVNAGLEPFPGELDLKERLGEQVACGRLSATTQTDRAVSGSEVVVVAVPLFVDEKALPDFMAMDVATLEIGKSLSPGTLVCYETTLPVGTTRNRLTPTLERESGLKAGEDFFVVFSPERVLTGRVFADLRKYPKLVGGINEISEAKGVAFYEEVLDFDPRPDLPKPNGVWSLGSAEAAEMAKLAETTYRDVNIGLANQFAIQAEAVGVDIYKIIEACNSQNYSHIHKPGVAVGGHCIPVYPHLYLQGDPSATIVSAAREANKAMPSHVISKVEQALGNLEGKRVAILGLAYRGGVKEHAFSGAWDLIQELRHKKATPLVNDPMYSNEELEAMGLDSFTFGAPCDAAIIQTDHASFKALTKEDVPLARFLVDGRNISSASLRSQIPTYVVGIGA
jgi:nucleotide sugar dehydrogenase